ncbi:alpha-amylase family glycosyl hydrolase [Vagococcus salmoninarum]|uniref:alpha-amylase family glycosyl hydrolase n=1 Tax=Vagococcus salmoninarum TaxID=2739 RepID=UPI003F9D3F6F
MTKWWQKAVFYQIYVPSFKDSNNDGIGDLKGVFSKLSYLKELGVDAIWLTPFYKSPKVDNGYDISDYYQVDADFGTLADFRTLVAEAQRIGLKIIADLVINHTSTAHPWFQESQGTKTNSKRDWYIWRQEPNNWESFFGGSAWEYDKQTKEYYYHSFAKEQADLNWANPAVKAAIFEVITFWLEEGIDGFRLDVINNLTVSPDFIDNPVSLTGEQEHRFDKDQLGVSNILSELKSFVLEHNPEAFLVGEISSDQLPEIQQYNGPDLMDTTFNFNLGSLPKLDVPVLFDQLKAMANEYSSSQYGTLFFGSHDMGRLWNRLAKENIKLAENLAVLLLFAKGIPFIYNGDEKGMSDLVVAEITEMKDIQGIKRYELEREAGSSSLAALKIANEFSRDKSRSPVLWEEGFTQGTPWLKAVSVPLIRQQRLTHWYQELLKYRRQKALSVTEDYQLLELVGNLLYFIRGKLLIVINFGEKEETLTNNWQVTKLVISNGTLSWTNQTISVPSYSAGILEVE